MSSSADPTTFVLNAGSSSLKFGVYVEDQTHEQLLLQGAVDGIGRASTLSIEDATGRVLSSEHAEHATHGDALKHIARCLSKLSAPPHAIGHRVVHGGPRLVAHQRVTRAVLTELRACVHFAPLHLPMAIDLIDEASRIYPDVPQFACFDTVIHNGMPEAASRFALPDRFFDEGVRRYGFHGLSYESILHTIGDRLPSRTVIAHLGSGASLAAFKNGKSVDTSMGLTPTGGIPMATRSGDLDPGILLYLLRTKRMDVDALEYLLNHASGLCALSDGRTDIRELEAATDGRARLALEIFCYSIRKTIGAYAAALGGLDMLVFTGGIGEHSAHVREIVCSGLGFLGPIEVAVIPTQENLQIARHCRALMTSSA